jgi:hypothetical protein
MMQGFSESFGAVANVLRRSMALAYQDDPSSSTAIMS